MGSIILVPVLDSWLVLGKSREINVLLVVHNIRMLITIKIHTFWCLLPLKVKSRHPLTSGIKSDWLKDMIMLDHLGFLHKLDNALGRNMNPTVSNVSGPLFPM